jgi:hypothetical protein
VRQKSFIDSLPLGADPEFYEFFTGNSFENEEHLKILIGRNKKKSRACRRPEKLSDRRCEKQIGGVPRTRACCVAGR